MGELYRDSIDKELDRRDNLSQDQEKESLAGKLSEVYILLGKGLPIGEIASELRIRESQLRELLIR